VTNTQIIRKKSSILLAHFFTNLIKAQAIFLGLMLQHHYFYAIHQIHSLQRLLPPPCAENVHSRLDYCRVVFAGLPSYDMRQLQSVLNSSIQLITGVRTIMWCHFWLPIAERIKCNLCTLIFQCMPGGAPLYLAQRWHLINVLYWLEKLCTIWRSANLDITRTHYTSRSIFKPLLNSYSFQRITSYSCLFIYYVICLTSL